MPIKCEKYDLIRDEVMKQKGLSVLRISNYEIDRNFEGVCLQIDKLAGVYFIAHPTTGHLKTDAGPPPL